MNQRCRPLVAATAILLGSAVLGTRAGSSAGSSTIGSSRVGASAAIVPNTLAMSAPNFKTTFGGYFQVVGGGQSANALVKGTTIGSTGHGAFRQTVIFTKNPNLIKDGKFAFTYADGSTLSGKYSGTATPPDPLRVFEWEWEVYGDQRHSSVFDGSGQDGNVDGIRPAICTIPRIWIAVMPVDLARALS